MNQCPSSSPRVRLLPPGIFFLTLVVFLPALRNGFILYDDADYLTANRAVQQGLTPRALRWAWTTDHTANWHPLTWMSHELDWQLFGPNPAGHHLVSILLHAGNAMMVFFLLRRMTGRAWCSAAAAALFALHPLRVESVAWASERKDVLSAFLGLLALWAYAGYGQRPRAWRYALVFLFLALGLLAKPMLVTLPLVMLLLDYWPLGRCRPWTLRHGVTLVLEKVPLAALCALSSYVTYRVQHGAGVTASLEALPLGVRLGNAAIAYARYLGKTVWPSNLSVFYPYEAVRPLMVVGAAALLLVLTAAAVALRRRAPYLLVGWLWFAGMLVPVIGLVQAGSQSMADRYTYLPHVGLFLGVAWGVADLAAWWRVPAVTLGAGVAGILATLSMTSIVYLRTWHDPYSLFLHANAVTRDNPVALAYLAGELRKQPGHEAQALEYYRRAYQLAPRNPKNAANYGWELALAGQSDAAEPLLRDAVRMDGKAVEARANLATLLARTGRGAEATVLYRQALRLDPDNARVHADLAVSLLEAGDLAGALEHARLAVRLDPADPAAQRTLGDALLRLGDLPGAIRAFAQAVKLQPRNPDPRFNLGVALLQSGRFDEAARQLQVVVQQSPGDAVARRALAEAMRLGGRTQVKPPGRP